MLRPRLADADRTGHLQIKLTAEDERVTAVTAADTAAAAAHAVERTALRAWRDQYRKSHGLPTALWPADPKRVESFFKRGKSAMKRTAPTPATDSATDS